MINVDKCSWYTHGRGMQVFIKTFSILGASQVVLVVKDPSANAGNAG